MVGGWQVTAGSSCAHLLWHVQLAKTAGVCQRLLLLPPCSTGSGAPPPLPPHGLTSKHQQCSTELGLNASPAALTGTWEAPGSQSWLAAPLQQAGRATEIGFVAAARKCTNLHVPRQPQAASPAIRCRAPGVAAHLLRTPPELLPAPAEGRVEAPSDPAAVGEASASSGLPAAAPRRGQATAALTVL